MNIYVEFIFSLNYLCPVVSSDESGSLVKFMVWNPTLLMSYVSIRYHIDKEFWLKMLFLKFFDYTTGEDYTSSISLS